MKTLNLATLNFLASEEPGTLHPVRIAASQNPGQSSGIVKTLTCVQAAWFCSQCISRMSNGMAISLLELNTFAHCVSAFFIYGFWWHKPQDVTSHTFIRSDVLDFVFLKNEALEASYQNLEERYPDTDYLYASDAVGRRNYFARVHIAKAHLGPPWPEREDETYIPEVSTIKAIGK